MSGHHDSREVQTSFNATGIENDNTSNNSFQECRAKANKHFQLFQDFGTPDLSVNKACCSVTSHSTLPKIMWEWISSSEAAAAANPGGLCSQRQEANF